MGQPSEPENIMAADLPSTMKAAVYSHAGGMEKNLKIDNVSLPKNAQSLPPDHALVKVSYATVNPVDYKVRSDW